MKTNQHRLHIIFSNAGIKRVLCVMKAFFYSLAISLFSFYAKAQENSPFTIGFEKSSPSKILGEQRTIWIHIPSGNGGNENIGKERYPVIYLLDGDANMLRQKQFSKAEALFKLNIANYPATANCYDGLGDLYLAKGDTLKAIESFKKTLSLKIIPETKQKLETLLKGSTKNLYK